jgi:hypothetical protein
LKTNDADTENNEGQRSEHNGSSVDEENNEGQRSEHNSSSVDDESRDYDIGAEFEETQIETEEFANKESEEHKLVDEDPRTEGQITHNLRANRQRNYSNRLGHIMDEPVSNKSYYVQLLQDGGGKAPEVREAVQEMQNTG